MEPIREFAPATTVEIAELQLGRMMIAAQPNRIQLKIVITPEGVTAISLSEDEAEARATIERLGIPSERIESRCVGECCAEKSANGGK